MTSTDGEHAYLFSRAVRETLDAVVAPVVREALIHDALELAGLQRIPEDGDAIRAFARGPLRQTTERALGTELAESVTDEILLTIHSGFDARWPEEPAGVLRRMTPRGMRAQAAPSFRRSLSPSPVATRRASVPPATQGTRSSPSHESAQRSFTPVVHAPRRRMTPPVGGLVAQSWPPGLASHIRANSPAVRETKAPPLVLVATTDDIMLRTLEEWLALRAEVRPVRSPADLVRSLDGSERRRPVVILDGRTPPIRPAALAALLEDQPGVRVVMYGSASAMEHAALAAFTAVARWTVYREPASLDQVAADCAKLVS